MPAIMEQVSRLDVVEQLRLAERILRSVTFVVQKPERRASRHRPSAHSLRGILTLPEDFDEKAAKDAYMKERYGF